MITESQRISLESSLAAREQYLKNKPNSKFKSLVLNHQSRIRVNVKEACITCLACGLGCSDTSYYDYRGYSQTDKLKQDLRVS